MIPVSSLSGSGLAESSNTGLSLVGAPGDDLSLSPLTETEDTDAFFETLTPSLTISARSVKV